MMTDAVVAPQGFSQPNQSIKMTESETKNRKRRRRRSGGKKGVSGALEERRGVFGKGKGMATMTSQLLIVLLFMINKVSASH